MMGGSSREGPGAGSYSARTNSRPRHGAGFICGSRWQSRSRIIFTERSTVDNDISLSRRTTR